MKSLGIFAVLSLVAAFAPACAHAQEKLGTSNGDMAVRGLKTSDFPRWKAVAPNIYEYEDLLEEDGHYISTDSLIVAASDGVLVLDPAMMVSDPAHEAEPLPSPPSLPVVSPDAPAQGLVAPAAAAAAASSVNSLVRTLSERSVRVHSGGPTIEDIVREELRPLLKAWLDENLPPLVERLVRAEIERVVGRAVP